MHYLAETVELVGLLNRLAEQSRDGIVTFDEYAKSKLRGEEIGDPIVYDPEDGKVVSDMLVDELHDDIVGYWDGVFDGVTFKVIDDGDEDPFVDVGFEGTYAGVVVEDGRWYVSQFD